MNTVTPNSPTLATLGTVDRAIPADSSELQEISDFFAGLPEVLRNAFVLRRFHGLEYDEIADYLDIGEQRAREHVYDVFRELYRVFA